MVWTLDDIIGYLDKHRITLSVSGGMPRLIPPDRINRGVVERVLPHVKARREELIAYFSPPAHVGETRDEVLREFEARAIQTGKKLYVLLEDGHSVPIAEVRGKAVRLAMNAAKWACVESDSEWTRLPDE